MKTLTATFVIALMLGGCASNPSATPGTDLRPETSALQTRQAQTRQYDVADRTSTIRSVIATLQDLGFTIDQADAELGAVTAIRFRSNTLRMTVTVLDRGASRVSVRASARIEEQAITDPVIYQDFFAALDKAMYLSAEGLN